MKPPVTGPKVLLTDTNRWALSARLAISLSQVGCQVSAVCATPGHPLLRTRAVHRTFHYSGIRPLESLTAAIEAVDPNLVIPCCDRSVGHLHELYARAEARGGTSSKLAELLQQSLGSPASYSTVASRYDLLTLAQEEGIRVPTTWRVNTPEELSSWQAKEPFPWVLKTDGTWGGSGVRIVNSPDQVQQSIAELSRVFGLKQAVKRLLVNRDSFWLRSWRNPPQHESIVQSYVNGRPANCGVFCWKGCVLAGVGVDVVSSEGLTGPASIVRVVDNSEMMFAAERIANRLSLSGFFGLDFMIEAGSGDAYLIEMNPRCTPLSHLRLGEGRDMVGALWAQLAGVAIPETEPVTQNDLIAYFPQAANGNQELLDSSFQDIPQGEPELVQELCQPWLNRTFLFRLLTRMDHGKNRAVKPANRVELKTYDAPDYPSPGPKCETLNKVPLASAPGRSS